MKNRLEVIDGCNAYYLLDKVTNRKACMGDGVGRGLDVDWLEFTGEDPVPSSSPAIGSEGFRLEWEEEANTDFVSYFEAYFLNLCDLEIYDNPKFADRYTVILGEASPLEKAMQHCADLCYILGLSTNTGPGGFSQHGYASRKLVTQDKRVYFLDLPENVQAHLARRLEDE